ncbi:MAG: hypothetical protein M2R45_04373 [Verrucomicrobia subdivision 3 bacterium]|nr:hypothetical protein [Limisphaerales bacterium]MCS1416078.1 hypothetical protein [Limisphaerales bacterium]
MKNPNWKGPSDDKDGLDSKPAKLVEDQILWLRRDTRTTPMHIVKLVYIAHGWMLGLHDRPLVKETVFAWQYGPVIPETYHRYKSFVSRAIRSNPVDRTKDFTEDQSEMIQRVVTDYRKYSAFRLSTVTHEEGTPWDEVTREHGDGSVISNQLIKEHYKKLAAERAGKEA